MEIKHRSQSPPKLIILDGKLQTILTNLTITVQNKKIYCVYYSKVKKQIDVEHEKILMKINGQIINAENYCTSITQIK